MPKLYNFLNIILILENQHYVLRGLYNRLESKWRNSNQQSVKIEEDYRPRPSSKHTLFDFESMDFKRFS